MAKFDLERALEARNRLPDFNLNELLSNNITEHDEIKIHDHRLSFELTKIRKTNAFVGNQLERIADSLDNIGKILEDGKSR